MKYFQLPPALAFVARAITQMEGVGVMLDEASLWHKQPAGRETVRVFCPTYMRA